MDRDGNRYDNGRNDSSSAMPSTFDRMMGLLHDLPDVVKTKSSTITIVPPLGVGGSQTFIVQTMRQREEGDTLFVSCIDSGRAIQLVFPPKVTNAIASQRDSLTGMSRRKGARAAVQTRAERGIVPGFLKNPNRSGRKRAKKRRAKKIPLAR